MFTSKIGTTTAVLLSLAVAGPAIAADRFEVTSIKAVRPTLVRTVDALQKSNPKAAKEVFGDFDSTSRERASRSASSTRSGTASRISSRR